VEVLRAGGEVEEHAVVTALEVNEGDVVRIHTGSGGGHGDPRRRSRRLVLDDVRNGYLTPEAALTTYGIQGV
jgi:N-methylhydantoinase B